MPLYLCEYLWFCTRKVHELPLQFTSKVKLLSFENQEDPLEGVCATFQNHAATLCVDLMFDYSTLQFQMLKVIELGLVWITSHFCIYAKCIFYLDMFSGLI